MFPEAFCVIPSHSSLMSIVTLIALSLALAFGVFNNGGVVLPEWNWSLLVVGCATALHFLFTKRDRANRIDLLSLGLIAIIAIVAAFQLVPLPLGLLKVLSPARYNLIQAASPILGTPRLATLSVIPYATIQQILTLGGCAAVFFVSRDLSIRWRETHPWAIVWPLLVIAGLEGLLGFFQFYTDSSHGTATGTYVNRDHYVGLLEMVLPFAAMYPIAVLNREREGSSRLETPAGPALQASIILIFATMILTGIVLSLSRMGFLASLAALFVCGAAAVSLRGGPSVSARIPSAWRKSILVGAVAVAIVLGFLFLPTDALVARFADLAKTDDISADDRARIWRDAIGVVKAFPLFGCGLGGFESAFLRYKTVAPMFTVDYAHNDYLQLLAELGVFGFLAGLLLAFRVLLAAVGRAVETWSVDERFLMIACTGSLTAIMLHSLVDFNLYVPANAMVLAWVSGIAITGLREKRRRAPSADQAPAPH